METSSMRSIFLFLRIFLLIFGLSEKTCLRLLRRVARSWISA